jgi:phage terminase Nu1 subunit (DNA packaging protein)
MGDVVGLPVPELERYVTRAQLAGMMGVHVNTVDKLVKQGMPSETWGLRTRRFKPSTAIAWARAQHATSREAA